MASHSAISAATNSRILLSLVCIFGVSAHSLLAQDRSPGGASTDAATPNWQRLVRLQDGRTFVSDGAFSLDAALAKPAVLPTHILTEATAKVVEGYLTAALPDEFALSQLAPRRDLQKYVAPSGVMLNPIYVDYLRRTLPGSTLRFRMKGDLEPIVIVLDSKAVGLLMPMKR
jgi:hypothetical protein